MARVNPRMIVPSLGAPGSVTDRSAELAKCEFHSGEADAEFVSFEEARAGGARQYTAQLTMTQDHAAATLWTEVWDNAGDTITGVYNPYGPAVTEPTVAQPWFGFYALVSEPDGLIMGGEATNSARAVASIEVEWELQANAEHANGKPIKLTTLAAYTEFIDPTP